MLILVFVVGMMGSLSVAFAQGNSTASCEATIKCVCQSLLKTRVVPCPTDDLPEHFFTDEGPPGTLRVDCSVPLTESPALCEDLDIGCKWWLGEHRNCILTLPLFVATGPTPCEHEPSQIGNPLDAACDTDVGCVCSFDSYCCSTAWDAKCVCEYGCVFNSGQGAACQPVSSACQDACTQVPR
jgi:hypothetical protein